MSTAQSGARTDNEIPEEQTIPADLARMQLINALSSNKGQLTFRGLRNDLRNLTSKNIAITLRGAALDGLVTIDDDHISLTTLGQRVAKVI